jgi:Acetyltransferase (GNAT) domain
MSPGEAGRIQAVLIPDGGLSASSENFFRSPMYLAAEGVTHTLLLNANGMARAAAPIIVRPIPGRPGLVDAISPYGYPGFAVEGGQQLDVGGIDWPPELVSLFVRDRLDAAPLSTARERALVHVVDPGSAIRIREGDKIRRNERRGFTTRCTLGPATSPAERGAFEHLYIATMVRVGAAPRYHFTRNYLDRLLSSPSSLILTVAPNGDPAAAAVLVVSDGWLHAFLGGTADAYLKHGPAKNVAMEMVSIAVDRGIPLNLGGGLKPGDSLDHYKQGFANSTAPFLTSEIIADADAYRSLCAARPLTEFFPAYRAPGVAHSRLRHDEGDRDV